MERGSRNCSTCFVSFIWYVTSATRDVSLSRMSHYSKKKDFETKIRDKLRHYLDVDVYRIQTFDLAAFVKGNSCVFTILVFEINKSHSWLYQFFGIQNVLDSQSCKFQTFKKYRPRGHFGSKSEKPPTNIREIFLLAELNCLLRQLSRCKSDIGARTFCVNAPPFLVRYYIC